MHGRAPLVEPWRIRREHAQGEVEHCSLILICWYCGLRWANPRVTEFADYVLLDCLQASTVAADYRNGVFFDGDISDHFSLHVPFSLD
jgi:hypothetical protein